MNTAGRTLRLALFAALAGCGGPRGEDFDGDGVRTPEDCDDRNAFVYPGAVDTPYDGIDQDCSGSDVRDRDGDGIPVEEDCDDNSASVYPGALDQPYDGVDADCSGGSDFDSDGDGSDAIQFGGTDCDDTDPDRSGFDADGDGFSSCGGDCDDGRDDVFPGAPGVCANGRDDDCDGYPECGLEGWSDLSALDAVIEGIESEDMTGGAVAVIDDLDGDARPDLAVAAHQAYDGNGAVHVITRPRDGTVAQDHALLVGSGRFGRSVAPAPGGVLVGALTDDVFEFRGAAYLFLAPLAPVTFDRDADLVLEGVSNGDRAGRAVAWAELDQTWIAVGAHRRDDAGTDSGVVYFVDPDTRGLHSLAAFTSVRGVGAWERAGTSLEATPDANGDGVGDLWVGAPGSSSGGAVNGTVYLFTGFPAVSFATSGIWYAGEGLRDQFGESLAVGDADGDGIPDLLVGAPFNDGGGADAGAAYLFLGPHTGVRQAINADLVVRGRPGFELGTSVELVDLDADGLDDVVVGGPGASSGSGGVAVFASGQTGEVDVLAADALLTGAPLSRTGSALAGGRLGGTPAADVAIGAEGAFVGGIDAGAVGIAWGGNGAY